MSYFDKWMANYNFFSSLFMCLFSWMVCCLKVKGSLFQREAKRSVNVCEEKAFQQVRHSNSLMTRKAIYRLLYRKMKMGFHPRAIVHTSLLLLPTHTCTPKHSGMSIHAPAPDLPVVSCVIHTVGVAVHKLWYFDCNHSSPFLRFLIISDWLFNTVKVCASRWLITQHSSS